MSRKSFFKIERAHRAPTQLKDNRKNPRPIHVAFVRYPDKMKIMANAAARLKNNPFDGNLIGFGADFSKETQECRKALVPFKKHLQKKIEEQECKVLIDYPATLKYLDSKDKVKAVGNEELKKIDDMKLHALIFMHLTIPALSTNFIYNYIIFSKVF